MRTNLGVKIRTTDLALYERLTRGAPETTEIFGKIYSLRGHGYTTHRIWPTVYEIELQELIPAAPVAEAADDREPDPADEYASRYDARCRP